MTRKTSRGRKPPIRDNHQGSTPIDGSPSPPNESNLKSETHTDDITNEPWQLSSESTGRHTTHITSALRQTQK